MRRFVGKLNNMKFNNSTVAPAHFKAETVYISAMDVETENVRGVSALSEMKNRPRFHFIALDYINKMQWARKSRRHMPPACTMKPQYPNEMCFVRGKFSLPLNRAHTHTHTKFMTKQR